MSDIRKPIETADAYRFECTCVSIMQMVMRPADLLLAINSLLKQF